MNVQLDNYKAPPKIEGNQLTGRTYVWSTFRYREIVKLGQGREKECWRAHTENGERAVLKAPFLDRNENIWIHFRKVIAHLDGHPNFVKTHDTFWTYINNSRIFFIVQDCYTNCIVYLINEMYFKKNLSETHSVFNQLASGLAFAHGKGAVLNDISLDNILYKLTEDQKVVVAYGDLGGVDLPEASFPHMWGNKYYSSLTVHKDGKGSAPDDVSSLAICVASIGWDFTNGFLDLPYDEYKKMADPKDMSTCFKNFKSKINNIPWKSLLIEMLADLREDRPTADALFNRVKELKP